MLSIENLTRTEKLRMMEVLWDDLARDSATLSSPKWHEQALKDAEHAVAENQAGFVSWDAARRHCATVANEDRDSEHRDARYSVRPSDPINSIKF